MSSVTLRNPHSVLEALRQRPEDVLEIRLPHRPPQEAWQQVLAEAQRASARVRTVSPAERGARGRSDSGDGRSGGGEAVVRERPPLDLIDLFQLPSAGYGLWLALDRLQDPHNVGAIFRTAAFFGVRGIVLTRHQSSPVTATVYDVASGGLEHVPFALAANLRQALDVAKERGLWVLGTSEHVARSIWEVERDRHWMMVLGNEEAGLRRLTSETCDELCSIPTQGGIGSLNVSVAAGVLLGALARV